MKFKFITFNIVFIFCFCLASQAQIDTLKIVPSKNISAQNIDNDKLGNMIYIEKRRKETQNGVLIFHKDKFYQFDHFIDSLKLKENVKFKILRGDKLKEFLDEKVEAVIMTESDYTKSKN